MVKLIRSSKFPKVNSKKMFNDLDKDQNKKIDESEWIDYWKSVKGSGYSEEEIISVLDELSEGKGWVVFRKVNEPKK